MRGRNLKMGFPSTGHLDHELVLADNPKAIPQTSIIIIVSEITVGRIPK